jgi:adenylyltransferase/sulfurtransferase
MGVLPGIMGSIQAAEVIKLLVGGGRSLSGRLLLFDAWIMRFSEVKLEKDPECPVCGKSPTITELADYEEFCGLKEPKEEETPSLTALELKERLDRGESLQIIDIREPHERSVYPFPGSIYVPFGQLQRRMGEFDQGKETVVICKIGQRSLFAIRALKRAGYAGPLMNLRDGVNAWAAQVEGGGMAY